MKMIAFYVVGFLLLIFIAVGFALAIVESGFMSGRAMFRVWIVKYG